MIDIYTCITAGYDDLKKSQPRKDVRYTAFMEGVNRPMPPWAILPVKSDPHPDPTRRSRQMKILSHVALPKADYTLWVDGCFVIRPDFRVERWIDRFMKDRDLVTFAHDVHSCTYEHAERIIEVGLDDEAVVRAQMDRYRWSGFRKGLGMVQTNVVLRRHTDAVRRFNELWWEELKKGSRRDQLSFVWAAHKAGLRYEALPPVERQYFEGKSHRGARTKP